MLTIARKNLIRSLVIFLAVLTCQSVGQAGFLPHCGCWFRKCWPAPVAGDCFGYYPTLWRAWPPECCQGPLGPGMVPLEGAPVIPQGAAVEAPSQPLTITPRPVPNPTTQP